MFRSTASTPWKRSVSPLLTSFLALLILLLVVSPVKAQSSADQAAVVKACLELPVAQQYFSKNSGSIAIMESAAILPIDLGTAVKMVRPVEVLTRADLNKANPDVFVAFQSLVIKGKNATAVFKVNSARRSNNPNVTEVNVVLQKTGNTWTVISSKFNKQ